MSVLVLNIISRELTFLVIFTSPRGNIIDLLFKGICMSLTLNKKIFILAGESSGDYIGSFLMDGLQDRNNKKLTFFGVGGPLMQKKV